MDALLVPLVNQVQSPSAHKKMYEVEINPTLKINVTVTERREVVAEWIEMFDIEHRSFLPVGVVVHTEEGRAAALTLSIGQQCLIFQLLWSRAPSRGVLVFLRDVCTCFGWRTEAYGDLLRARYERLALGGLTDIRSFIGGGYEMGLGDFSTMIFGRAVPEPSVHSWTRRRLLKKKQIRETAMEAYICQQIGLRNPHVAPPNNSLTRVTSVEFPTSVITEEMNDRTMYKVFIDDDRSLRVTYTTQTTVLASWLTKIGRRGRQVGLIGIDIKHDQNGAKSVMALAFGNECLVYNLYHGREGCVVAADVFNAFLDSDCPLVGWNPTNLDSVEELGLEPERILNVRDEFPFSHTYEDLARLELGYEMTKLGTVARHPDEEEIMGVSLQAYTCLRGGIRFGYENREWNNEG